MKFSHKIEDETLIIELSGDLIGEQGNSGIMEVANSEIEKGVRQCIIDISDVRYINSSGIGLLITMLTKFRNKGGEVCLLNPSEGVKKLLIITKLAAIFNIVNSVEEALETIKASNA